MLKQFADLKVQVRAAEEAARGFALTGDPGFADEFRQLREAIGPAFAALLRDTDDPAHRQLLEETATLVERRLAILDELIRHRSASESAGLAAGKLVADARNMSQTIWANLDRMQAELAARLANQSAESRLTGRVLLVDRSLRRGAGPAAGGRPDPRSRPFPPRAFGYASRHAAPPRSRWRPRSPSAPNIWSPPMRKCGVPHQ